MGHAHTKYTAASAPPEALPELVEENVRLRAILLADVQALVTRGWVNGSRLSELKGTNSYQYTAYDVFLLVEILREHWEKIEGKTALQMSELNAADVAADKLSSALSERDQAPQNLAAARDAWQRSFTLFVRAYNDVRRAVQYLDGDNLDKIAPTIYVGRGPGKKKGQPELPDSPDPIKVEAPPVAAGGAPSAMTPGNGVPAGMPGADPFIRTPS